MKMRFRKIVSLILVICFVFSYMPQVSAFEKTAAPEPTMTPLQDLKKNQVQAEENREEIYEELTPEEQEILDEINNNTITVSSSEVNTETVGDIQATDIVSPLIKDEELETMTTTSTASTVTDEEFKVEPVASVYNVLNNNNDYVSQATGALTYEKNLLSLPGVNGLDLNLSVRYNSDDAVITTNEFKETSDDVRKINFNNFAIGWSFGFPTILKSETKKAYGWQKETHLQFPDGSSYKIKNDFQNPSTDKELVLEYYKLSDMKLVKKAETNNYELTYTNGNTYTFDGDYGNLISVKDKYDNEITLLYNDIDYFRGSFVDYIFNPSFYKAKIRVLADIYDSSGRLIAFNYDIRNTAFGNEIKKIEINVDGISQATLCLKRISTAEGSTDILEQIIDAEGFITKFTYDEKSAHIHKLVQGEDEYNVNGSVLALTKVDLPTGGWIKYDYKKARRTYVYYRYDIQTDWYEVYKVSRVSDSSGFERTYEYVNDRSGYPGTYLDITPIFYQEYVNIGPTTGYLKNTSFVYHCIMKQKNHTTVTTFNYMHNKIKEYSFDNTNVQNDFMPYEGDREWSATVGNYVYHIGRIIAGTNKNYFYRQNIHTGETVILTPYEGEIPGESVVKTSGNKIFIFSKTNYLSAIEYDTVTQTWNTAGQITTINQSTLSSLINLEYMQYTNSKFYIPGSNACVVIYDPSKPVSSRWEYLQLNISEMNTNYSISFVCQQGSKLYYYNQDKLYEYNLDTSQYISKDIGFDTVSGGFTVGERTFVYNRYRIYEFEFDTGTILSTYYYANSNNIKQYYDNSSGLLGTYIFQKDVNGNMYYIMKSKDADGYINVYRFEPDNTEDKFVYVGSRMMENTLMNVYASGTAEKPTLLFVSDGVETMKLYEPETPQSTTVVTTNYNSYNQPITKTITRISGLQRKETGTESYTYVDKKSNILSSTDILGNKTTYEYDTTYYMPTKVTQYADTDNAIVTDYTLSEDKKKTVTAVTTYDDVTLKTEYTYDTAKPGNVITEKLYHMPTGTTYSLASQKDYTYVENGALVGSIKQSEIKTNNSDFTLTDAEDITVTYTYNNLGQLEYETDSLGRIKAYVYTEGGLPYEDWYINGSVKEYFYQINGNRYGGENVITNRYSGYHDGEYGADYITFSYLDDLGRVIKQSEKDPNGSENTICSYEYTGHNVTKVTDALGNFTLYDYDAFDRVVKTSAYDKNNNLVGETTITYDDFNLTRTVNNSGKTSKTYYDKLGRVIKEEVQTDAGLAVTQTEYDYMGNMIKTTDAKGEETEYSYNDRGLLLTVTNPLNQVTEYTYDAFGNTLTVTNAGRTIQTNTYDSLNRLLTTTDAMGYNNKYQYDKGGRVVKSSDKKGQSTTYEYKPDTDYLASQTTGENTTNYTYDDWGNMLTSTNNTGTYEYKYKFNNLLERIKTPDNKAVVYTYDNNHNITKVKDYSGNVLTYAYNGLNKIDTVNRNGVVIADYDYYNFGALQKVTYPGQGSSEFAYDNALRLTAQTNKLADNTVTNTYAYTYDKNGNQLTKTDNNNTTSYVYDNLNQLTRTTDPDGTVTQYGVDTQGNIEVKIVTYPESISKTFPEYDGDYTVNNVNEEEIWYSYDNNNRLISETAYLYTEDEEEPVVYEKEYCYDENGNLSEEVYLSSSSEYPGDPVKIEYYTYNELNQLTSYNNGLGETTNYTYAPDGMRRSKTRNNETTTFYWDRGYMSAESVNNTFTAKNYIGATGIFARQAGNNTEYMLKNGHGDVTNIIKNGTVTNWLDYDPYGNQTMGNTTNPFRYCGEYFDEESGLIYLRNRYYSPEIGRFITEDPAKDGLNWYAYCGNNPINFVDPLGLTISLPGITSEDDERFVNLQQLTDDELSVDLETGVVSYTAVENVEREVGTNLVREIVDSEVGCEIIIEASGAFAQPIYDIRGNLENIIIKFDPNYSPEQWSYVDGVGFGFRSKPSFIALGHELVHTIRFIKGVDVDPTLKGKYLGGPLKLLQEDATAEELNTIGTDYTIVPYGVWNLAIQINASQNYYTENAIRLENDRIHKNELGYIQMGRRIGIGKKDV